MEQTYTKKEILVEGLSEKDVFETSSMIEKFVKSYTQKDEKVTDEQWLESLFKREIPETSDEEVFTIVEDGSMLERLILEDFESEVISALFKVISSLVSLCLITKPVTLSSPKILTGT